MTALRIALVLFACARLAGADNWPFFRGPTRQGFTWERDLPLKWSDTENVVWKTAIPGAGWSSPIVWGERVFVTTTTHGGASCRLLSLDRASGKVLWDKEIFRQTPGIKSNSNSFASSTPCTDGRHVYVLFADGSFAAVDFEGQVAWSNRDFPFHGVHGMGTSPVLWEDLLIMARDGTSPKEETLGWKAPWDQSYVLAVDKASGKMRWKTPRGMSRTAHVTPNIWLPGDGRDQIISSAGDVVQGMDAETGKLIFTSKNPGHGVVPSIVLGQDMVFVACGWGGRESIRAFRLGEAGNLGEKNLAWEVRGGMPKIPSFLYMKPYLYVVSDAGIGMCIKADSGEVVWKERIGQSMGASPVGGDGRIYFLADSGETAVIEAGPQFKVLARNPLHENTRASMAVSDGKLFIRTEGNLYCVGKK